MKIVVKNARIAFPNLFQPNVDKTTGKASYGGLFIIGKDHPQKAEIEAAIVQVAKEKWADKADAILKQLKAGDKLCLHDGAIKAQYDGFDGNLYISANNKARPTVVDRDKTPLTQADGKPYSGCYVNISLDLWAQDSADFGKRINASLLAVQFAKDGEAFSGGAAFSDDDFDVVEGGDDAALF